MTKSGRELRTLKFWMLVSVVEYLKPGNLLVNRDVPTRRMRNSSRKKKKVTVVRPFRFATASRRRGGGVGDTKKKKRRQQRRQRNILEQETKVRVETTRRMNSRPPIPRPTTGDSRKVFEEEEDVGSSGDYTEVN